MNAKTFNRSIQILILAMLVIMAFFRGPHSQWLIIGDIIKYSGYMWGKPHPDDLSRCENYKEFMEKLNFVVKKLFMALRKDGRLAILVGDIRSHGHFYSMQRDLIGIGKLEATITKAQFNCVSDVRTYKKPFIPIVTEYLLLYYKDNVMMVFFTKKTQVVSISARKIPLY